MKPQLWLIEGLFDRDQITAELLDNSLRIHQSLTSLDKKAGRQVRKFIVMKSTKDDEIYIVIGPEFVGKRDDPSNYKHMQLRQVALHLLAHGSKQGYQIAGGGSLVIEYKDYMGGRWSANFGGESDDYGVYDHTVLFSAQEITDWLGMEVMFNWSSLRIPTKK